MFSFNLTKKLLLQFSAASLLLLSNDVGIVDAIRIEGANCWSTVSKVVRQAPSGGMAMPAKKKKEKEFVVLDPGREFKHIPASCG